MRIGTLVLVGVPLGAVLGNAIVAPFPEPGGNPALDLMAYHDPAFHKALAVWHYAAPGIATLLAGSLVLSVWRVWLRPRRRSIRRGKLPPWPVSPADPSPSVVVGELHHPTAPRDSERPSWLVIPETGLYTTWRKQARTLCEYGGETPAVAIESCAAPLEEALRDSDEATLTLTDAAKESGYSTDHLGRLVREGKIPNAGRPGTPSIARSHLPRKTCAATPRLALQPPQREVPTVQIVQSVIDRGG